MSSQALAKVNPQELELAQEYDLKESVIQTIKDTIAKDATNTELRLFLETAKRTGLDPMARQIFCVKRYAGGKSVMSVQISIDGFRLIADRTGQYVPSREPSYVFDNKGKLVSATAYVKKLVGGTWHEIPATAFYDEYVQTTKEGPPNSMWRKMPRLMLAKCAESLALRKAFPAQLSGLYTPEEMNTSPEELHASEAPNSNPPLQLVPPTPAADQPQSTFSKIADTVKELQAIGDKPEENKEWDKQTLAQFANDLFAGLDGYKPVSSVRDLDESDKQIVLEALTFKLDKLREFDSEMAIEGEVVADDAANIVENSSTDDEPF